jgi:hypothetical protein
MIALYLTLGALSGISYVVFLVWLAIESYKVKPWWPVVILLTCGVGALVFKLMHRDRALNPYRYAFTAFLLFRLGCFLIPTSALQQNAEEMLGSFTNQFSQLELTNVVVEVTPNEVPTAEPAPVTPSTRPRSGARPVAVTPPPTVTPEERPASAGGGAVISFDPPAPPKPSLEFTSVDLKLGESSSMIDFEVSNGAAKGLKELKLTVTYLNAAGVRKGTWSTLHQLSPPVAANGKAKFSELAMKLPAEATKATATITEARFTDGTYVEY